MKAVSVRDQRKALPGRVAESRKVRVLLWTDDSFWRLLQRRRRQKAAPLATVKRRLGVK